ncbi:MAG: 30S ribosomal protein S12 methylthiotransferase RimO [bacterium]|nr:30S ribosomal protein S12 methylthiotransferase RimO [bacterium]
MSKVHFISLGCPKNRVDAEHMLGIALNDGHALVDSPEESETIIINTCSFIGEAKKESIDAILRMGEIKKRTGQKLIVTGCLAQRYGTELEKEMPEVDHFLGTSDFTQINKALPANSALDFVPFTNLKKARSVEKELVDEILPERNLVSHELRYLANYDLPRVNSMPKYTAYIKISEGCDNACAFCIIPKLRGKQRSRNIADIVKEAEKLAASGVVELSLIAQDLTAYGHDIPGRPTLAQLLEALNLVEGIRWVRCMYAYPRSLSADLMRVLADGKNTLPYLDMPVQHGSNHVLRKMRRGKGQERLTELLLLLRSKVPNLVMRSTLMVGFPFEKENHFEELMDFVKAIRFERIGVFKYSDEEDTDAFDFAEKVPQKVKVDRYNRLMTCQHQIHQEKLKSMIGEVHEAIVEGISEEHALLVQGRLWSQAPDIDGKTYLSSYKPLTAGQIVHVRITDAYDYDLVAEVLDEDDESINKSIPFGLRN